jgi:methyl-accepting chemotaxis protein
MQFDSVVQQNSAASEQLAASAEELSGQATALQDSIAFFKLTKTKPEGSEASPAPVRKQTSMGAVARTSRNPMDASFEEF